MFVQTIQSIMWVQTLIYNDAVLDYAHFARSIEITRKFLEKFSLPQGATAIILVKNLLDSWRLNLALRGLGLTEVVPVSGTVWRLG
jgi:hypothetical protein